MITRLHDDDRELRLQQLLERLKQKDYRMTPQRYAVLKVLVNSPDHPSAEDIHARLIEHYPTMSLATVYKTINLLKREGEILELEFSDLGNRYDGHRPYPHAHVICNTCGKIIDPSQLDLDEIIGRMMTETGFKILTHRLDFYGVCPNCQ